MTSVPLPRPTDAELAILRILWDRGSATVREVHEQLPDSEERSYTTTLKFMQIMTDKGLVVRNTEQRTHIYKAAHPPEQTRKRLVNDLINRAFNGSAANLILNALNSKQTSPEELKEIRSLLDQLTED